ncbi:hypothetical protein AGMMS49992_29270 [Clostridia bacterium]|nr:hypothetical protein AGMMS49992_29270 [Clostridia bacterium]
MDKMIDIIPMDVLLAMDDADDGWTVADDSTAEWAIARISDARQERDRLCSLADSRIDYFKRERDKAERQCSETTERLSSKLSDYFRGVQHKQCKTQETYKLLSGTLRLKYQTPERIVNDAAGFTAWAATQNPDMIKVETSPRWSVVNTLCEMVDNRLVYTPTGEVVPGVEMVKRPDVFEVVTKKTELETN